MDFRSAAIAAARADIRRADRVIETVMESLRTGAAQRGEWPIEEVRVATVAQFATEILDRETAIILAATAIVRFEEATRE